MVIPVYSRFDSMGFGDEPAEGGVWCHPRARSARKMKAFQYFTLVWHLESEMQSLQRQFFLATKGAVLG
ncbi:hypothetical protein RISK_006458 [Rhodopirellula islandica]|uniref:Uncharacterized protein n=1 Tax=Rhodopirellula islandica TaxID=595434 RepID=A0A0J1B3F3_RHOIS|nr:hypothetical protein RISK_006458 [Rhodopirellula islandica]